MKRPFLLFIPLLTSLLFSCDKSEKYYITEDDVTAFELLANPSVNHAVFLIGGDIYYAENLAEGAELEQVTETPEEPKRDIRISPDHKKVSYVNVDGNIVVVNISDGSIQPPIENFSAHVSYEWLPTSDGFYFLVDNLIKFNRTQLAQPNITLGANDVRQAIAFSPNGSLYFMVTEKPSSGASSTKLYYWDKKKFFLMNYELSDQIPAKVRFNVSSAGDLTLCVSSGSSGEFDSFYVYPKDSINYSYKKTVYRLFNAKFDSRLKQEVYFSEPDFGFYNNVSVNNYNGYARSKSFVLDSSFYKGADAEGLPREMDWKQ